MVQRTTPTPNQKALADSVVPRIIRTVPDHQWGRAYEIAIASAASFDPSHGKPFENYWSGWWWQDKYDRLHEEYGGPSRYIRRVHGTRVVHLSPRVEYSTARYDPALEKAEHTEDIKRRIRDLPKISANREHAMHLKARGLSFTQIGRATGTTTGCVSKQISTALSILRGQRESRLGADGQPRSFKRGAAAVRSTG